MLGTVCDIARRLMLVELQGGLDRSDREFLDSHLGDCVPCRHLSTDVYNQHSELSRWGLGDLTIARQSIAGRGSRSNFLFRFALYFTLVVVAISLAIATVFALALDQHRQPIQVLGPAYKLAYPSIDPSPIRNKSPLPELQEDSKSLGDLIIWRDQQIARHFTSVLQLNAFTMASTLNLRGPLTSKRETTPAAAPPLKKQADEKAAGQEIAKKPRVDYGDMSPRAFLAVPKVPTGPRNMPIPLEVQVRRLGIDPGLRYDKLLIFPVVNHTSGTRTEKYRRSRVLKTNIQELPNLHPNRLLVSAASPFSPWPIFPGLIIEANGGLRISQESLSANREEALLAVFSVVDPDQFLQEGAGYRYTIFRNKVHQAPALLPSQVRATIVAGEDSGATRRAFWEYFLPSINKLGSEQHFVPEHSDWTDSIKVRYERHKRVVIDEMREFTHLVRIEFAKIPGFRGVALSIGDRPLSIDVFKDTGTALAALDSLIIGQAIEAYEENNFTPTSIVSRNISKQRYETLDFHKFIYGQVKGLIGKHGSTVFRKTFRNPQMQIEIALESEDDNKITHLSVINRQLSR